MAAFILFYIYLIYIWFCWRLQSSQCQSEVQSHSRALTPSAGPTLLLFLLGKERHRRERQTLIPVSCSVQSSCRKELKEQVQAAKALKQLILNPLCLPFLWDVLLSTWTLQNPRGGDIAAL